MNAVRALPCFLIVASAVAAQGPDQPIIRVVTRLVDVSVIARNTAGPVADLTADDFTVFDNGANKKIAFFSVNSVRGSEARFTPLGPNVFSNRPELRPDAPVRISVVVLDGLNTAFEFQARARLQFLKFAREIGPRDRVAVYAVTDHLRCIQDFTNSPDQLIASLDHYRPSLLLAPDGPAGGALRSTGESQQIAAADAAKFDAMSEYYRMHVTTDVIKDLAQEIARIPGRKNLLWLSTGFPMEIQMMGDSPYQPTSFQDQLGGAGRALARTDAALYPIDVAGLAAPTGGPDDAGLSMLEGRRHKSMDVLAELTGGKAFYGNDLLASIRDAVKDAEVTYTIGFYPDTAAQDGSYHRLRVAVNRKGVELRYRPGYLAADSQIPTAEADGRESIRNALASPLDVTGIALTVRVQPPDPLKRALRLTIAIPASDIDLRRPESGSVVATLDVVVAQYAADGRELTALADVVQVGPDRQGSETLLKEGLLIRREIPLQPGVSRFRVVVFDRGSGRLGSLEFLPPK